MSEEEEATMMDANTEEEREEHQNIVLAIDGENHTLGNVLRDVMWKHPHVQLASYTQEHPSSSEIIVRCQTNEVISAEQGVVESLHVAKQVLHHMGDTMQAAIEDWDSRHKQT